MVVTCMCVIEHYVFGTRLRFKHFLDNHAEDLCINLSHTIHVAFIVGDTPTSNQLGREWFPRCSGDSLPLGVGGRRSLRPQEPSRQRHVAQQQGTQGRRDHEDAHTGKDLQGE